MLSMETVKFYRLGDVEAKRFATPKARSGALDLPPGTYAVTIGKDHLLLRILFHNPIGVNLAPLASYSKELAAGFVDTGKASTSISIQDLANAQTMAVASTASSQGYRITRLAKIGENSNTLVLKVKHSRQQGETALKRPNPSSYDQMTSTDWVRASQAWLNEFSIHRQLLSTPNASKAHIVQLFGGDARLLSLHMELATHRSLADWVVDGVFTGPRELAHFVLINIAAGLEYCHSQNIIQNDLKPQNIFMHYSRGPVLGDIGCATRGASMFAGGTSLYIAPEYQATGGRGAPGDIWALGLTMMFVLKVVNLRDGRFAFNFHKARGQDVDATRKLQWWIEHITKQRDEVLPNCRSWATGLIQYMLDSNPVSRPTASNVLREAFRRRNEIATLAAAPHQLRAGAVHPRPYRNIKDLIIPGTGASTPKSCMQLPQQASSTQNQEWETLMANSKLQPGNGPTQILPSQGLRRAPRRNEGRSGLPQHP